MTFVDLLHNQLPVDEGTRAHPYLDTVGKLTIGVGRNLDDVGLRPDEIYYLLDNDIREAETIARGLVPDFDSLTEARKAAIVNMAFNLGPKLGQFHQTLDAINGGRWDDAADFMLDSLWARQVGNRAQRIADAIRRG